MTCRRKEIMAGLDQEMIERVKADKKRRRSTGIRYQDRPGLAFIVQSFNRISNIEPLIDGLRGMGQHELIVCEDGSLDGSREKWMSYLDRPNDFLIHSNDLHEIRILDRAIRFARADIVCLVQDDDVIPRETDWLESALRQFSNRPKLAILGGFQGFESFDPDPAKAKRIWGGDEFRFVHHVNIGPYFIRRRSYEALGGWEYSFSEVGEPGICCDTELCLRAWMNNYQVGYSFVPFKGSSGHYPADGGTVLFSDDIRVRNSVRNSDTIFQMYGPHARRIDELVAGANSVLVPA
jgi:glycosyltransferase involved in cell wall biosynthesis